MASKLTKKAKQIEKMLSCTPPDYQAVEQLLAEAKLDELQLGLIAFKIVDACTTDGDEEWPGPECHSKYVKKTMELLLRHGLNLDVAVDGDTILSLVQYVTYPHLAGELAALFMEAGGNPNFDFPEHPGTVFEDVWGVVCWGITEEGGVDKSAIDTYLVYAAYGGSLEDRGNDLTLAKGYDVSIFKNIEPFAYEQLPDGALNEEKNVRYYLRIFRKDTGETVALWGNAVDSNNADNIQRSIDEAKKQREEYASKPYFLTSQEVEDLRKDFKEMRDSLQKLWAKA